MSSDPYQDPVYPWCYVSGGDVFGQPLVESFTSGEWRPLILDENGNLRIRFGNANGIFTGGAVDTDGVPTTDIFALDTRAFSYLWNGTEWDREQKNVAAANSVATVGVASVTLLAANNNRDYLLIQNLGAANIYVTFGAAATVAGGIEIQPGGNYEPLKAPRTSVTAISTAAGNDVRIVEG